MRAEQWSDDEIIKAVKASGIAREKALYYLFFTQDWKGLVIRHVLKNGGNEQDGEDLAQTVIVIFDRNLRQDIFKGDSSLKTYFFGIARLQWYKALRNRRTVDEFKPEQFQGVSDSAEDTFISEEKRQYFDQVLGIIGERCKKILLLQQLEHSMEEIAAKVRINGATMAKKEAYRCRMRIRQFLEENPGWKNLIR